MPHALLKVYWKFFHRGAMVNPKSEPLANLWGELGRYKPGAQGVKQGVFSDFRVSVPLVESDENEPQIARFGCWAHVRRDFFKIYKGGDPKLGAEFVALVNELDEIEESIRDATDEKRLARRHSRNRPMREAIKARIDELLPVMPDGMGADARGRRKTRSPSIACRQGFARRRPGYGLLGSIPSPANHL